MKPLKDKVPNVERRKTIINVILMILAWFTISPLLFVMNKNEKYMKRWIVWLLVIVSPLFTNFLGAIFLVIFGVASILEIVAGLGGTLDLQGYPEFTQFSTNPGVVLLELFCLPVYAFCVFILYGVMMLTDWDYPTASVMVCEYAAPLFCAVLALALITVMSCKMPKMSVRGRWLMVLPILAEAYMACEGVYTYLTRHALYEGMTIDAIFRYVVDYLMGMAERSHTNYILANMYVYILPVLAILFIGLLGRIIYRFTRLRTNIRGEHPFISATPRSTRDPGPSTTPPTESGNASI